MEGGRNKGEERVKGEVLTNRELKKREKYITTLL